MMNGLLTRAKSIYQHLPTPARHATASIYGYYLRMWRFGPETDRIVGEALERETWTEEQWRTWQDSRIAHILHRAATRVPYYREHWLRRRRAGDRCRWDELENWPVLEKEELRRAPKAFLADDVRERSLFQLTTSGTSGTPVTTWRTRSATRTWYGLHEARGRRWYGVDRSLPWAILGGQVVTPADQRTPPFWVWNAGLRQLYLSSLHLTNANAEAYARAMARHGVRHLYGYSSTMYDLARVLRDAGVTPPRLVVAVSNAEPLLPHQRELVGEVFGCPVRETYGLSEIVAGASECEHGRLHLWPEAGFVEVLAGEGERVAAGSSGDLVATGLLNDAMPLVRYRVGDRAALSADRAPCACGRTLPRIDRLEGRVTDNLFTPDGRRVFWLNPVFYGLPIHEGQIVQRALDRLEVNIVPDHGFGTEAERAIQKRLRQRLGEVAVEIRTVEAIPRGANGKFKSVVNAVPADPT